MKPVALAVGLLGSGTLAFPGMMMEMMGDLSRRQAPSTSAAKAISQGRTNCGPTPCGTFSAAEQFVSISGDHAYAAPGATDIRGPCPGLNAAANHGYISRNGISTVQDAIVGLGAAYGMAAVIAGFLAAYAVIFDGDPVLGTWSIGGPPPSNVLTKTILGQAQGISYSHNVYEGDGSISRPDAYLNNGNAYSLNIQRFTKAYAVGVNDQSDRYTLDKFAALSSSNIDQSISTNPYYFAAPFSGLVAPAAYNFVINMMSNHSAAEPNGYLNGEMLKQFFAVTGNYPNFQWHPGQERIPNNWYRRPSTAQYGPSGVFGDVGINALAYPGNFRLGGNTNGVNTYTGVSLSDFTGGVYNADNLFDLKGSRAACFYAQLVQALLPDSASLPLAVIAPINNLINNYIKPITGSFGCPIVDMFDQSLFNQFPGYKYRPQGPNDGSS